MTQCDLRTQPALSIDDSKCSPTKAIGWLNYDTVSHDLLETLNKCVRREREKEIEWDISKED